MTAWDASCWGNIHCKQREQPGMKQPIVRNNRLTHMCGTTGWAM